MQKTEQRTSNNSYSSKATQKLSRKNKDKDVGIKKKEAKGTKGRKHQKKLRQNYAVTFVKNKQNERRKIKGHGIGSGKTQNGTNVLSNSIYMK